MVYARANPNECRSWKGGAMHTHWPEYSFFVCGQRRWPDGMRYVACATLDVPTAR